MLQNRHFERSLLTLLEMIPLRLNDSGIAVVSRRQLQYKFYGTCFISVSAISCYVCFSDIDDKEKERERTMSVIN